MAVRTSSPAIDRLVELLGQTERRLRRTQLIADLLRAVAIALVIPLVLLLGRLFVPVSSGVLTVALLLTAIGLLAFSLWRFTRASTLAQAAAELDARANLRDELKSAEWFVSRGLSSRWIDEQVTRASERLSTLPIDELCPIVIPRQRTLAVGGTILAIFVISLVPVSWTRGWFDAGRLVPSLSADELSQLERIEMLVRDSKTLTPGARERLQQILTSLQENALSPEETMQALEEARRLLNGTEAEGKSDSSDPQDGASGNSDAKGNDGESTSKDGKTDQRDGNKGAVKEGETTADKSSSSDALEEAGKEIEDIEDRLAERQREMDQRSAKQQSQQSGQRQQSAQQDGQQGEQSSSNSDESQSNSASSEQEGEGEAKASNDQGSSGDVTGAPKDPQGPLGKPTSLPVTLKKESAPLDLEPETLTPKELINRDTRAAQSTLDYQDVTTRTPYTPAEPLESHAIPWPYREHVKSYFKALGPRTKHDH